MILCNSTTYSTLYIFYPYERLCIKPIIKEGKKESGKNCFRSVWMSTQTLGELHCCEEKDQANAGLRKCFSTSVQLVPTDPHHSPTLSELSVFCAPG